MDVKVQKFLGVVIVALGLVSAFLMDGDISGLCMCGILGGCAILS